MADDTKLCASCAKPLPADAAFCSGCGAQQRTGSDAAGESSAFELAEEGTRTSSAPAAHAEEREVQPTETDAVDSDLLEIEFDEAADEEAVDEEAAAQEAATEQAAAPKPSAPASAPEDEEEAPQTGETVRMKMSDVAKAWGEETAPEEGESDASDRPASTGGLPKGFIVAVLASLAVMAMLLYFLV